MESTVLNIREQILSTETRTGQKAYMTGRLSRAILRRMVLPLLALVPIVTAALVGFTYWRAAQSPKRCQATAQLAFYPKQSDHIKPMSDTQVFQLLRPSTIHLLIEKSLSPTAPITIECSDFAATMNNAPGATYSLTAWSKNENEALRRVNAYAEAAIDEYIRIRREDLKRWGDTTEARRQEINEQLRILSEDEQTFSRSHGVPSLDAEIHRFTEVLADRKISLNEYAILCKRETDALSKLEEQLGAVPEETLKRADEVANLLNIIDNDRNKVEALRAVRQDDPKDLQQAENELSKDREFYDSFIRRNNLENIQASNLRRISQLNGKIKETKSKLNALLEEKGAKELNVEAGKKYISDLMDLLPLHEKFKINRSSLEQSAKTCDSIDTDIRYLDSTLNNELVKQDEAKVTEVKSKFTWGDLPACLISAAVIVLLVGAAMLVFDFQWGYVHNLEELCFIHDVIPIGIAGDKRDSGEKLFFRFQKTIGERRTVFIGALPGARKDIKIMDSFALQCALGGKRILLVEVVEAKGFTEPEGASIYAAISCIDNRGWMPVANPDCLSASELLLMEADLKILTSDYDLVFVTRKQDLVGDSIFGDQMKQLCDATILLIGAKKTPRNAIRDLFHETTEDGPLQSCKPTMAVLTDNA